jgi:hypothetical protein
LHNFTVRSPNLLRIYLTAIYCKSVHADHQIYYAFPYPRSIALLNSPIPKFITHFPNRDLLHNFTVRSPNLLRIPLTATYCATVRSDPKFITHFPNRNLLHNCTFRSPILLRISLKRYLLHKCTVRSPNLLRIFLTEIYCTTVQSDINIKHAFP